jgi:hypothetical protein
LIPTDKILTHLSRRVTVPPQAAQRGKGKRADLRWGTS